MTTFLSLTKLLVLLPELVAFDTGEPKQQLGISMPSSQLLQAIGKHFVHHWVISPRVTNLPEKTTMNLQLTKTDP